MNWKSLTRAGDRHKEILGASWLNGRLKFRAYRKGLAGEVWDCPDRLELGKGELHLAAVFKEAVQQTGYQGTDVGLALEHAQLSQQLVETPPTEGRDLELFLERRVQQLKTFDPAAAWSYRICRPTRLARGLVLYLFPKPLLDELVQGCHAAGLHLVKVVHPTALLDSQRVELPLGKAETAMLAAETEGTTAVTIGRKEGAVFLERSLGTSWTDNPERVSSEMHRTLLFVKQQFGEPVSSLWLFGAGAQQQAEFMQATAEIPVHVSPVEPTPAYWIDQVAQSDLRATCNLITKELQKAPQRRVLVRVTGLLLGLLLGAALLMAVFVETQIRSQSNTLEGLKLKTARFQTQKEELAKRFAELEQSRKWIQFIEEQKSPPVPGWFLGYVADILPDELVLVEFQVKRVENLGGAASAALAGYWSVRLAGQAQALAEPPSASVVAEAILRLENRLVQGPFHLKITSSTRPSAGSRAVASSARPEGEKPDRFVIEGTMQ